MTAAYNRLLPGELDLPESEQKRFQCHLCKEAWEELVSEKLIIKDGVYYILSPSGRQLVRELHKKKE